MLPTIRYRAPARRNDETAFDLDRWFDGFFDTPTSRGGGAADLWETEEAYELMLDVPGFAEADIDVTVDRGVLVVTASRTAETEDEGRTYHMRERRTNRFARSFALPASIVADEVDATLDDGVLHVRLPKSAEAKARRIAVTRG